MEQIWKYELKVDGVQKINMPEGAKILTVQTQFDNPCIWALVNPTNTLTVRNFEIYGTGHNIQIGSRQYIGTFQVNSGFLIFHVFELL